MWTETSTSLTCILTSTQWENLLGQDTTHPEEEEVEEEEKEDETGTWAEGEEAEEAEECRMGVQVMLLIGAVSLSQVKSYGKRDETHRPSLILPHPHNPALHSSRI